MKRDIYRKLLQWKSSPGRKPLLLKGARQVGKTYILKRFGEQEYDYIAYLNFEENPLLNDFFRDSLAPEKILKNLSLYLKHDLKPKSDLIIFDEIQASNNALNSLKYFNEKANTYHVVAAGSLLGIKVSSPKSFPVGKVNFLHLYPLTFLEFLEAVGQGGLKMLIEETASFEPYPEPFHQELIDLLKTYYVVGGMPEAVRNYSETNDLPGVQQVHRDILNGYVLDFAKHAPPRDIPKLSLIWESISSQLAKENKKFIFSAMKKTARAREYENALQWLQDADLILRVHVAKTAKLPLGLYADRNIFKVYALDVGLLCTMANISSEIIVKAEQLFTEFKGALVENYVAQQLKAHKETELFYWRSNGAAELDFLFEHGHNIFPLETKAGINPRSKSLTFYAQRFAPNILSHTTLLNLKHDGKIHNYPLYAISLFPELSISSDDH